MELFMETYMRSEDRKTKVQQFVNSWAQPFVVHWFSTIFFLKLLFSWIWWFHFLFQETYNSRLKEIYGDDPSTNADFNLNLWLEAGLSSGPDRNRVYRLSNTTPRTCRRSVVFQLLGARNRSRALSPWNSRPCMIKECKNVWPISMKNMNDSL